MINIKSKGDELLETRLNEATNPLNPTLNTIATQAFCDQVLNEPEGHQIAVRLLAHKVQSPQEKEALYAFCVIDECIKKCGPRFHQEVGKFRFLNELIKVISPKYLALTMSSNVKKRCIECLYSLYKGLPHESKITEAYNMLKKQNIISKDPTYLDDKIFKIDCIESEKTHSIFDSSKDAERLSKLLKSRNPEDLREANRIIKNIVQEDNQRIEMISKRASEIETIKNNIKLLDEMLSHYEPVGTTEDDLDIMRLPSDCPEYYNGKQSSNMLLNGQREKQLIENLEKSRAEMFKLSRETDDVEILNDVINVIEKCNVVIKRYWELLFGNSPEKSLNKIESNVIEKDLLGDSFPSPDDLLSKDLQSLGISGITESPNDTKYVSGPECSVNAYQDLLDIFPVSENTSEPVSFNTPMTVNYSTTNNIDQSNYKNNFIKLSKSQEEFTTQSNKTKKPEVKGFEELDILSKELLNISMQKNNGSLLKFNQNQDVELISNLEVKKSQKHSSSNDLPLLCNDLVGIDQPTSLISSDTESINHPVTEFPDSSTPVVSVEPPMNHSSLKESQNVDLKSFNISLSSIKPDPLKIPVVLYNNLSSKLKVMLHFCNDKPHPHVNVLVAQISSENENQVTDIILKFAISKPMKVHKQHGSTNVIQAHSPFTPSTPLNEIVLIFNPASESADLKFHLSYEINGESFLESGHTGSIKF